jgi:hypothetical protein
VSSLGDSPATRRKEGGYTARATRDGEKGL